MLQFSVICQPYYRNLNHITCFKWETKWWVQKSLSDCVGSHTKLKWPKIVHWPEIFRKKSSKNTWKPTIFKEKRMKIFFLNRWIQIFRDFKFLFWHEFNIYLWTIFYSFGLLWLDRKRTRSLEETTVLLFGCAVLKTYTCNFLKPRHKSIHKWNKNVNSSTLFKFLNIWISVRLKENTQLNFDYFWISLLYRFFPKPLFYK